MRNFIKNYFFGKEFKKLEQEISDKNTEIKILNETIVELKPRNWSKSIDIICKKFIMKSEPWNDFWSRECRHYSLKESLESIEPYQLRILFHILPNIDFNCIEENMSKQNWKYGDSKNTPSKYEIISSFINLFSIINFSENKSDISSGGIEIFKNSNILKIKLPGQKLVFNLDKILNFKYQ